MPGSAGSTFLPEMAMQPVKVDGNLSLSLMGKDLGVSISRTFIESSQLFSAASSSPICARHEGRTFMCSDLRFSLLASLLIPSPGPMQASGRVWADQTSPWFGPFGNRPLSKEIVHTPKHARTPADYSQGAVGSCSISFTE